MKLQAIVKHAEETARVDYLAKFDTTERKAALLQCAISAGARNISPEGSEPVYKFATLADYKEVRTAWMDRYGEKIGWSEESGTQNPAKMAFSRLDGTALNPNAKEKAEKAEPETTEEKPLTLKKQLNNAIDAKNEPLAVKILAQIFSEM